MSRWRLVSLLTRFLVATLAGGCTPLGIEFGMDPAAPPESKERRPDLAEVRLAEAAERAEAALTMLSRIRAAETSQPVAGLPLEVPPALRRPVTIDWIGPVETLAEHLAAYAGYSFRMAGPPPVRPAMVAIAAQDAPVIEVLRDAGLQAGDAATLTVDAEERSVRLDWTPLSSRSGAPVAAPGEEGA